MRAEQHAPPAVQIQLQPVKQNNWRVESNQEGRDGSSLAPEPTEEVRRTVKGVKPVSLRVACRSVTAFKASQRLKLRKLLLSQIKIRKLLLTQVKNAMKTKLIKLKMNKPKPQQVNYSFSILFSNLFCYLLFQEVDVVPVPVVLNPHQNAQQKETYAALVNI